MSVGETGPHDSKEDAGSADVLADPALQAFVDPSFDSTQYASSVLKNPKVSATEKTHMLQAWVIRLDEAIQEEVTSKQEELFSHVRQLQVSDRSLQAIRGSVSSFHEDLKQLRSEAQGPFQLMAQHTTEPRNLHETLQLLRAVNSRMKQTGKLQQVMQQSTKLEPMDLAKAAKLVHDIETGTPASELAGIMLIEQCVSVPLAEHTNQDTHCYQHGLHASSGRIVWTCFHTSHQSLCHVACGPHTAITALKSGSRWAAHSRNQTHAGAIRLCNQASSASLQLQTNCCELASRRRARQRSHQRCKSSSMQDA